MGLEFPQGAEVCFFFVVGRVEHNISQPAKGQVSKACTPSESRRQFIGGKSASLFTFHTRNQIRCIEECAPHECISCEQHIGSVALIVIALSRSRLSHRAVCVHLDIEAANTSVGRVFRAVVGQ